MAQVPRSGQDLSESLERWRETLKEGMALDLDNLAREWAALAEELDRRLEAIEGMVAGQAPGLTIRTIELPIRVDALAGLTHFEKAAFALLRDELLRLEGLTRDLFATATDIRGFASPGSSTGVEVEAGPARRARSVPGRVIDPERLGAAVQVMAVFWLAYLIWIYTLVPGGASFVIITGSFGMALATMPFVRVSSLFLPAAVSILFASLLYVFVMPRLASFVGLGLLLFAVTFAIGWLFHTPRQGVGRTFGLVMFVTIAGISNEQTYNFLSAATTALMFLLVPRLSQRPTRSNRFRSACHLPATGCRHHSLLAFPVSEP